jgi:transcriptional regulator with XRE-family HTH domain
MTKNEGNGEKFVELRAYIATQLERKRLSQKELADKLGRDPSTISNWIHGRQPIPLDMLTEIAEALEEDNPVILYELAGLLAKLPGKELVKLVQDLPLEHLRVIEQIVRAYVEAQKH